MLWRLDIDNYLTIRHHPGLTLYQTTTAQTGVARMHVTAAPFQNTLLRQAMLTAIDHESLLNLAHFRLGLPAEDHHVCSIHPEYAELPRRRQDYQKARHLLNAAGYPQGLSLSLDCVTQPKWESNTCLLIAEQLKPIGIDVKVNIFARGYLLGKMEYRPVRLYLLDSPPSWDSSTQPGLPQRRTLERNQLQ